MHVTPRTPGPAWLEDRRFVALLFVLLVLAVYAPAVIRGAFHFDDFHNAVENESVRTLSNVPRFFTDASTWSAEPGNVMYRPVLMTTYALDYSVWGFRGAGWVLTNVLLHACVAILVWRLALRLGLSPLASAFAGAVSALHPVHSEVVNYVSSRSESLAAIGVLAAVHLHLAGMAATGRGRVLRIAAAAACGGAALLAKETAALLFAAIAVLEFVRPSAGGRTSGERIAATLLSLGAAAAGAVLWQRGERAMSPVLLGAGAATAGVSAFVPAPRLRGAAVAAAPFLLALGVVMAVRSLVLAHATAPVAVFTTPEGADAQVGGAISILDNLLHTQSRVAVLYLQLLARPALLSVDHDVVRRATPAASDFVALAIHGAIVVWALLELRRGRRLVPLCVAWYWLFLAPSVAYPLNVVMNEHRLYLPGTAVAVFAGAALARVAELLAARREGRRALTLVVSPLLLLVVLSVQRTYDWRSDRMLWESALRRAPESPRALMHLGAAYHSEVSRMRPGEGMDLLDRAIELYAESERRFPAFYDAQLNLGTALLQRGRMNRSEPDLTAALEAFRRAGRTVGEHWYRPRFWQAQVLVELGRIDEAVAIVRELRAGDDSRTTMYDDAEARMLRRKGDLAGAAACMERVIAIEEPEGNVDGLLLLGWWRFEDGDAQGSLALIDRAMAVSKRNQAAGREASFVPFLYAARWLLLQGYAGTEADGMVDAARRLGWGAPDDEVAWVRGGATPGALRTGTRNLPTYGPPK